MTQTYPILYHIDQNDNVRVWWAERRGDEYRTHSGIEGGAIVTSDWRKASPKNEGRSNATTGEEQADLEIKSSYRDRLERKYSESREAARKSNFLAPMLADTFSAKKHLKKPPEFFYAQPKFDGIRCLINEDFAHSRSGKPFSTIDHIRTSIRDVVENYHITFDGELYNHDLREDFEKIASLVNTKKVEKLKDEDFEEIQNKVQYHVYDVILHDRPSASVKERFDFLFQVFQEGDFPGVVLSQVDDVDPVEEDIFDLQGSYVEQGYEGLMLRDPNSPYEFKRTKSLIKVKTFQDAEFEVVDIAEGQGNWAGIAKSVTIRLENGETQESGIIGSMDYLRRVLEEKDEFIGGPATVKFQNRTVYGKLRFPVVKILYGKEGRTF